MESRLLSTSTWIVQYGVSHPRGRRKHPEYGQISRRESFLVSWFMRLTSIFRDWCMNGEHNGPHDGGIEHFIYGIRNNDSTAPVRR